MLSIKEQQGVVFVTAWLKIGTPSQRGHSLLLGEAAGMLTVHSNIVPAAKTNKKREPWTSKPVVDQ